MKLLLLLGCTVAYSAATWTLSGYACQQPQIYNQCQCPSICSGYSQGSSYYPGYSQGGYSQGGYYDDQLDRYRSFIKKHRPHHKKRPHHHHKKKFQFSEEIDETPKEPVKVDSLEEFDSREFTTTRSPLKQVTNSWDNEEAWEQKFKSKIVHTSEEELPEISSAEIEAARVAETRRPAPRPYRPQSTGGGSGMGGIGLGGGVGVGGIGVNTGLGISAPGIGGGGGGLGGLGGGGGGLVGVSSGLGIGIPGVGPIGISSGLGIGK